MITAGQLDRQFGDQPLFITSSETTSYTAFAELIQNEQRAMLRRGGVSQEPVYLEMAWQPESFAKFIALGVSGQTLALCSALPGDRLTPFADKAPLLILKTGGSTGKARHIVHAFNTLMAPYALTDLPPKRQLVLYAPDHIAGLDAFFQGLHRGSAFIIPANLRPQAIAACIEREAVEVLPATPTFLQFLLLSGELEGRRLDSVRMIPHGAEPMPLPLRDRIREIFPNARLIHRFGLTELGALPVREDPEEPEALFLKSPGYTWQIIDGELFIKSPSRLLGTLEDGPQSFDNDWYPTGDLAELTPRGSIRILGRRESVINVGGNKVVPELVEALLLESPLVTDVLVRGIPNPLTGEAVAAEVVFLDKPDPMALLREMRELASRRGLSIAHVPTKIDPVESISKTPAGKRFRRRGKA